tara:strand:+ start:4035 stop:5537 length:1503 start_codon:yes stop_codon:yes gene_type:complete
MVDDLYDVLVIGGGVNGAGIARDAAGRGLKTLLVEGRDLASSTSSASTKIIHGGLRYLEYFEFRLVREALREREVLLKSAPHIMWPLEFILPHDKHLRPAWFIRIGLFFYDNLAKRIFLPASKTVSFKNTVYGKPLRDRLKKGFSYADGWVEDSRLVVMNVIDAKEKGADILPYTACVALKQDGDIWEAELKDTLNARPQIVRAKTVVNAAGPWVSTFLHGVARQNKEHHHVKLVKGSHIIVSKLYQGEHAYILQHHDKRIVFTIPYEGNYTLIGTTDVAFEGDPSHVQIEEDEILYLCDVVNEYFKRQLTPRDVVSHYSGVRPLLDDGAENASAVTRDYKLDWSQNEGQPPLLSIYGGKITTHRKLSEQAVDRLCEVLGRDASLPWTKQSVLPGGDFESKDKLYEQVKSVYPWLHKNMLERWITAYGTRLYTIIGAAKVIKDLGQHFGEHVYQAEIDYMVREEFARSTEDILWRRSKLGLHLSDKTKQAIADYMKHVRV